MATRREADPVPDPKSVLFSYRAGVARHRRSRPSCQHKASLVVCFLLLLPTIITVGSQGAPAQIAQRQASIALVCVARSSAIRSDLNNPCNPGNHPIKNLPDGQMCLP
jgi:hypothetical protein